MINIVCTSKPNDGLFYYSYEHMSHLNAIGVEANLVVICHPGYIYTDYLSTIQEKYIHCKNIVFDDYTPDDTTTLIMGRSMITLAWRNFESYTNEQRLTAHMVFNQRVISVYSENHPVDYPKAVEYFGAETIDLCDQEVYVNGVGENFEKRINFDIYKPTVKSEPKYKYLVNGSNRKYYKRAMDIIHKYDNCAILTYANDDFHDKDQHNIHMPVDNILGLFETYVYTKDTFDPAPRIIQECQYYNIPYINDRGVDIHDGGSVYMKRSLKPVHIEPILKCL